MAVVIITLSNKPNLLHEAVASVAAQTRHPDQHIIGLDDGSRDWDGRYPPAVFFNETARELDADDYVCWLSDDDLLLPNYVADLAGYLDRNLDCGAVYGFSEHWIYTADGVGTKYRVLPWDGVLHHFNATDRPSGMIDGGQYMVRKGVLDAVGYPYIPEGTDPDIARLCDAHLMIRVAAHCGIAPLVRNGQPVFVLHNRTTPWSSHGTPNAGGSITHADWRRKR